MDIGHMVKKTSIEDDDEAEAKEFKLFEERMNALSHSKLGFPTSLLGSNPAFVHYELLGIRPGSLASILINHAGDPFVEADSYHMEVKTQEVALINTLATYFGIPEGEGRGYVTSGGTEGNDACLRWAKQYLTQCLADQLVVFLDEKKARVAEMLVLEEKFQNLTQDDHTELDILREIRKVNVRQKELDKIINQMTKPSLFCTGENTHYSIPKIAESWNMVFVSVDSYERGSMNLEDFEKKIHQHVIDFPYNPIVVNANIGTTFLGATDNVPKIKAILENTSPKPLYTIHMDGALNGFVLPILKPFGEVDNYFKFADSLAISFHKYLGLPQPSGLALTTKGFLDMVCKTNNRIIEYAGNIKDITVSGSRSGFNVLMVYNAIIYALGLRKNKNKLVELVHSDLERADYFSKKLAELLGSENVYHDANQFNIVIPKPPEKLIQKYQLMSMHGKSVICVLNNVTYELIEEFMIDLKQAIQEKASC
jgi:histidine decarboxylase